MREAGILMECTLCPRRCQVNRSLQKGFCSCTDKLKIARIGLHFYEEPPISGTKGSGAVFFSGCNLRCVFCQNMVLQRGELGEHFTPEALSDALLKLQDMGAHNINLVTPTPHTEGICRSLSLARKNGLRLPVVCNTNAYMTVDTVKRLGEHIDIWLPDFKYHDQRLADAFSSAPHYFETAFSAIQTMYALSGELALDDIGMAAKGVLIRHLVLPGCVYDTREILSAVCEAFGKEAPLSLMRQYTPPEGMKAPLNRRLTAREYDTALNWAMSLGMENIYTQEASSASFAYTPPFGSKAWETENP